MKRLNYLALLFNAFASSAQAKYKPSNTAQPTAPLIPNSNNIIASNTNFNESKYLSHTPQERKAAREARRLKAGYRRCLQPFTYMVNQTEHIIYALNQKNADRKAFNAGYISHNPAIRFTKF